MFQRIRCLLPRFRLYSTVGQVSETVLPQLHPLLIQRAVFLQNEHKELSKKLDSYDPELQIQFDRISQIMDKYEKFISLSGEISELSKIKDHELIEDAKVEIQSLVPQLQELCNELKNKLLPPVKYAECKTMIELRPGVGGNEASLFTEDLLQSCVSNF